VAEISTALSRVSAFFVVSTTSSFTLRGRVLDLADLGRELGVRYVLEGSLQQAGDRLRIFTNLVEAESGRTIWQDRFDGTIGEIFDLQDTVAERVAATLEPRLVWAETARARTKPTESLTAHDLCLQAAPLVERQNSLADLETGLALLEKARALDPDYVYAKGLYCAGHTGAFATRWWTHAKASASLPVAHEIVDSETDDAYSLAYGGHQIAYLGKDRDKGLAALKRATRINPNSATACLLLGWVHVYRSEIDEALEHLTRMRRISPLHPQIGIASCGMGNALFQAGRLEEAAAWYERAVAEYPEFASSQLGLMGCYWAMSRLRKAMSVPYRGPAEPPRSKGAFVTAAVLACLTGDVGPVAGASA
jgi:tetratricopeptide (TPR) repeat protein